jgi:hypothetical protein
MLDRSQHGESLRLVELLQQRLHLLSNSLLLGPLHKRWKMFEPIRCVVQYRRPQHPNRLRSNRLADACPAKYGSPKEAEARSNVCIRAGRIVRSSHFIYWPE